MKQALAKRALSLKPSPTLALDAKAKQMQKEGIDVVNLGIGEPDFDTPRHIKEAAVKAIEHGFTKYTPAAGIPELKEAICSKLRRDNALEYDPAQIVVSVGAKHAIYNALQVLVDEGDEVIVPAPYWVSYTEMVRLAGGVPVEVPTSQASGFRASASAIEAAVTPRTKLLMLNSPCNPSGAVYGRKELEAIADVCLRHGIYVISDEIYEKLVYDGHEHVSIASLGNEMKDLSVVINGVSKAFAMTGWRIGYSAARKDIAKAMADFQSQVTSNPTSISQKAAAAALNGPIEPVLEMVGEFDRRRKYVVERLQAMKGVSCHSPEGAFYVYPDVSSFFGKTFGAKTVSNSAELADALLSDAKVAVVPGTAFGLDGYIRISYATSMEKLREGLDRIEAFLGSAG